MNIPNFITLARLFSVPIVVLLILNDAYLAAFWIFIASGISDAVDGFIAKRFGRKTELGAYLDPIADKSLLVAMFVTLGMKTFLPAWLVILVVSRDILIVGAVLLAFTLSHSVRVRPVMISKVNTALQLGLVGLVLAGVGLNLPVLGISEVVVYLVGVTTVLSGLVYLVDWLRQARTWEESHPELVATSDGTDGRDDAKRERKATAERNLPNNVEALDRLKVRASDRNESGG